MNLGDDQQVSTDANADSGNPASPRITEHALVRLTFWQTILSVAGIVVAVVALYAALTESAAVREQTAASVWPYVQFSISDHKSDAGANFSLALTNTGVGPARMQNLRLILGGEAVHNWEQAVSLVNGNPDAVVARSFITYRVISPGETVNVFSTTNPDLVGRFQKAMVDPDSSIAYCYCSIFDACWLADSTAIIQQPTAIDTCPDFGEAAYGQ